MRFELRVPARINILGNPTDGLEGDYATISAAIELHAGAIVEAHPQFEFEMWSENPGLNDRQSELIAKECYPLDVQSFPLTGALDLIKGSLNRLYQFSSEYRQKRLKQGMKISAWSEVPRQSGLGGSSLFVILTLAGARALYDLDSHTHNNHVLAELTQRVELRELNITCGYVDRYIPIFGGIAYVDFRNKLHHRELGCEPFATYEHLDPYVSDIPIVIMTTGIQHQSGDVHARLRPYYMQSYTEWLQRSTGNEVPAVLRLMEQTYETAWRGKIALLSGDLCTFGELMTRNHHLVNEMMFHCGFEDGAGLANNLMIETALQHGALGAKLTGAGGGGSVFALVQPGTENYLIAAWQQAARAHNLSAAYIYRPRFSMQGLTVEQHG